jgi:hypothetical protein
MAGTAHVFFTGDRAGRTFGDSMDPQLPSPDPDESLPPGRDDDALAEPTAVFMAGPASPEGDRMANAILDMRPGLLLVYARD